MTQKKLNLLLPGLLLCVSAWAQETPATEQPASPSTPLNLDADNIAKEMSKEQHPADAKPESLSSSTTDAFNQSILDAENRKKVNGIVEAGAGVGRIPGQPGFKGADVNCEYTGAAVTDEVSRNTQIGISAYASTCKAH
jgi:hypothetical protein